MYYRIVNRKCDGMEYSNITFDGCIFEKIDPDSVMLPEFKLNKTEVFMAFKSLKHGGNGIVVRHDKYHSVVVNLTDDKERDINNDRYLVETYIRNINGPILIFRYIL